MNRAMMVGAILAMLCTLGATLLMLGLCLAGAPNSTEAQLTRIKIWAGSLTAGSVIFIVIAIVLLFLKRPGWATGAAILPTCVMLLIFCVLALR